MKRILIAAMFSLVPFMAQAEVRPTGTVLLDLCGELSKSTMICTAQAQDSKNYYLVLTGFAYSNHPLKGAYYLAEFKDQSTVGAINQVYKAYVIERHGNYVRERIYTLTLSAPVTPYGPGFTGHLTIDGENFDSNIFMEPVVNTENADQ